MQRRVENAVSLINIATVLATPQAVISNKPAVLENYQQQFAQKIALFSSDSSPYISAAERLKMRRLTSLNGLSSNENLPYNKPITSPAKNPTPHSTPKPIETATPTESADQQYYDQELTGGLKFFGGLIALLLGIGVLRYAISRKRGKI